MSSDDPLTYRIKKDELRRSLRTNYATTAAFYLGPMISIEIPKFHFTVWNELMDLKEKIKLMVTGHLQKVYTVPREHSKTTIVKLAATNVLRDSQLSFLLYVSTTQGSAANALRDIVEWFKSDQETEVWGKTEVIKSNEGEGLWILAIRREDGSQKQIILRALGVNQKIRGINILNRRPDFIIIDDIEDEDTADSGHQQKKLDTWMFGTLLKASAKLSLRIMIGNLIRDTTMLARLCQDPEWNPTNFGCLVRNTETGAIEPLWPGMHTVESLLADYRRYRRIGQGHTWESEMMNLSKDVTLAQSIDDACMVPTPTPEDVTCGFIVLDPAFGLEHFHDEAAFTVHARIEGVTQPVICDSRLGRFTEEQMFDVVVELINYWGLTTLVVEAVAGQRLIIPLFKAYMKERQMSPEAVNMFPIQGQSSQDAKASRIRAFRSALDATSYLIADGQIDMKLAIEEWTPESKSHDDLVDSASLGLLFWHSMGEYIKVSGQRVAEVGSLLFGAHVDSSGSISEFRLTRM